MIVVTGATGQLGSQIVTDCSTRVPADSVGVSVRDPARAAALAARGVRVRRGDFTDPARSPHAFEGARQVLDRLRTRSARRPWRSTSRRSTPHATPARSACSTRAIRRPPRTRCSRRCQTTPPPRRHLAGQRVPFTALRNGFYASTIAQLLGRALETGELVAPADGPVSWTAHADLAAAAAVVLADEGRLDGVTPPLTAPEALDLEAVAGILSELTGRTVRRVVADDEEWVSGLIEHGMPEAQAPICSGMFRAARRGEFADDRPDPRGPDRPRADAGPGRAGRSVTQ